MNPCNKKGETDKDKEKERKQKISSAKKEEEPSALAMASTSSDKIAVSPHLLLNFFKCKLLLVLLKV
jgi:hypothetical protein